MVEGFPTPQWPLVRPKYLDLEKILCGHVQTQGKAMHVVGQFGGVKGGVRTRWSLGSGDTSF